MTFARRIVGAMRVGAVLILSVALLFPLLAMVVVFRASERLPGVPDRVNVLWGEAIPRGLEERLPGVLTMTLAAAPTVKAPSWSGVVTGVTPAGTTVAEGAWLIVINGIQRRVCAGKTPLFRPLTLADVGDDVVQLRHCLEVITGRAATASGDSRQVDAKLANRIQDAAELIGAGKTKTFDPGWVLWTSTVGWKLASIEASVNSAAPSQGAVVAKGVARVTAAVATVVNDNQSALTAASQPGASAAFEVGTTTVRVDAQGRPTTAALVAAGPALQARASNGDTGGGVNTSSSSGSGSGTDSTGSAKDLGADSSGTVTVSGAIVFRGTQGLQFPVTAVATSPTGKSCVFVRKKGIVSAVNVRVIPISVGSVIVKGALAQNDLVAYNAADVTGPRC